MTTGSTCRCGPRQSHMFIAEAARTRRHDRRRAVSSRPELIEEPGFVAHGWCIDVAQGETLTVEKVVALHTSRDHAISEPALAARTRSRRPAGSPSCSGATCSPGISCGAGSTSRCQASPRPELALRVHIFHLLQTVSPNSIGLDCGVPARGLHGEAYRGHIFWDELFVFPLLNLRLPVLTRSMLDYRFRRLARPAGRRARRTARRHVPVAERQRRPGGDPDDAPQPPVRAVAARQLPPAAPHRHRRRLQRVELLPGHR